MWQFLTVAVKNFNYHTFNYYKFDKDTMTEMGRFLTRREAQAEAIHLSNVYSAKGHAIHFEWVRVWVK